MPASRQLWLAMMILFVGLVALSLCAEDAAAGKAKKKKNPPESGPVDPHGKPTAFGEGKKEMYAIWFNEGSWHLRVTTHKKDKDVFTGTVRVNRGKMIGNFKDLEKGKNDKADWVFDHRDGAGFDFRLVNFGKLDTLNFRASPDATELLFDLKIGGVYPPERVLVGKKNHRPSAIPFTLPAHP